ncbi:MAG: winged helix-turn-helix transcriptional regulator [archaeon]|nr:winged helix-turn-helix transcriptional regulator [archaeon]
MTNDKIPSLRKPITVKKVMELTDPGLILIILHEKRMKILKLLLDEAKTIQDLRKATGINPGTVKRHIEELRDHGIIFIDKVEYNDYNVKMNFYRAIAKSFLIKIEIN